MRIALLISSLGAGGAERVVSLLANGLVARGHDVSLITLVATGSDFYALDARVRRLGLGLTGDSSGVIGALRANVRRVTLLRRTIRTTAPDAVLAFVTRMNVLSLFASVGLPVRVVVSERIDPVSHTEGPLWEALRILSYRRAAAVVVQTERIAQWFRARAWRPKHVLVIPNPVSCSDTASPAYSPTPHPFILGAGRLVPQKGFDLLIRAFSLVAPTMPELHLVIAGEGREAQQLRQLAASLGVTSKVLFLGNVANLSDAMRAAQVFVLSSRYEGFPNVLLEALACGVPTVATDCRDGPREILEHGKYGLLVPCEDAAALAAAIVSLCGDQQLRQKLMALAPSALAPYEPTRVLDAWLAVLGQS